jgi:hypothetical protein
MCKIKDVRFFIIPVKLLIHRGLPPTLADKQHELFT